MGYTQAEFYRSVTESGASMLDNRWDFLWRDIFHSHNIVLELLYETGAVGLVAFTALLAALIAYTNKAQRLAASIFALGYVTINSVWFEFAHTIPLLALAVAALTAEEIGTRPRTARRKTWPIGAVIAAAGCFSAAVLLNDFDQRIKPFKLLIGIVPRADYPTDRFPEDPRGNDFIRAALYRDTMRLITHGRQNGAVTPETVTTAILDDIQGRLDTTPSPELLLTGLAIFGDAYFHPRYVWLRPVVADRGALWDRLADRHLVLAPKRTDLMVVYLSWQVTHARMTRAADVVRRILRANPDEPVGLYFKGVIDTNDPSPDMKRRGLREIAQAVENGVERFVEIPEWLKKLAADANAGGT